MQPLENVKDTLSKVSNEAKETASTTMDKVVDFAKVIKDKTLELSSVVKDKSIDLAHNAKDKTLAANEATIETIKNNPYKAVGSALLIGFALAKYHNLKALIKGQNT